ncbi:DMT family transporter [Aquabacterium sp.]|uniref:DMT family transporter n=1 Tax=Aquabacterium sp. TaxID=1872578 RepID=UPI002CC72C4A|nr:DMT family transporter [Aquabacterium sp.]HSW07087.1 DMT family transporter [Aquabacterium sp.]
MNPRALPALALVFNAFTWGVSWWPFRQFQQAGLHALWVTTFTFTVAVIGLLVARPAALRELLRTPTMWVLMLAAGLTNACFNWAVTIGDVVRVVLLFYLMPLWAVLLARPLLGERIGPRELLRVALALAGAAVVLWPAEAELLAPVGLADALAVIGGFTFALNNVMLRREAHRSQPGRALAMFSGGVLVSLLLAAVQTHSGLIAAPSAQGWVWPLAVAGLAAWFVVSNLALQYGAARLRSHTTAVIMISEVVFAAFSALLLGAGTLSPALAVGGALIVTAALLAAID